MSSVLAVDRLQAQFGLSGVVRFEEGPDRLVRAVVTTSHADAHVYLQGAHVTHYQPRGQHPVLFLSARSFLAPGKAIRGGVPVVFPWFGPRAGAPGAPMHGFARVAAWQVESVEPARDGSVTIGLRLDPSGSPRTAWPHDFVVRSRIRVGPTLDLGLEVHNVSTEPFTFEEALHTYLAVGDVRHVSVSGLGGTTYMDKPEGMKRKLEGAEAIRLVAETDRVYLATRSTCVVDDPTWDRRLVVEKQGSDVTVMWNPWSEKARAMADLGDEEWPGFICIETANAADHAVALAPGARHEMRAVIRAEPR